MVLKDHFVLEEVNKNVLHFPSLGSFAFVVGSISPCVIKLHDPAQHLDIEHGEQSFLPGSLKALES